MKDIFQFEENGAGNKILNSKSNQRERSFSMTDYNNFYDLDIQNLINQYILEFRDEIIQFKEKREKEIIEILKRFFSYKFQLLNDINTNDL